MEAAPDHCHRSPTTGGGTPEIPPTVGQPISYSTGAGQPSSRFRISDFGFPSDFGPRISGLRACGPPGNASLKQPCCLPESSGIRLKRGNQYPKAVSKFPLRESYPRSGAPAGRRHWVVWFQVVKALPNLGQGDGRDKKMSSVLSVTPSDIAGVGTRFLRFADGVRVEHEIHSRNGLTKSSGIRGGSQSVVSRTESSHAFSFFMR